MSIKKLKYIWKLFSSDLSQLFVSAFAYSLLLSLAPLLIVFVLLLTQFAIDFDILTGLISAYLPADIVVDFINYLQTNSSQEFLSLFVLLVVSFWLSSKAAHSILRYSTNLENVDLPAWRLRLLAIYQQIVFVFTIVLSVALVSFTNVDFYLVVIIIMFIGFLVYYRNLSITHRSVRYHWAGALLTTFLLSLMGIFFYTYINNFTRYESLYGPMASLMVILLSIYLISLIIHFGFLLNFVLNNEEEASNE